jgi:limonene 1,2-monooxygenase
MVMPIHLADSKKEALEDIREGGNSWIQDYFIDTLGAKIQFEEYPGQPREEMTVERMVARGGAIVGTPDDAIARIREVQEASGGFGGLLGLAHEWASREKTLRSYELFARYVMPQFQGTVAEIEYSQRWAAGQRELLFNKSVAGIMTAMNDYKQHREAKGEKPSEIADQPVTRIRP